MNPTAKKTKRNNRILILLKRGLKQAEIARMYGVSRQRIWQLIKNALDK